MTRNVCRSWNNLKKAFVYPVTFITGYSSLTLFIIMEYFMKKFNISSSLLAILVLGFVAFGCNENEDPPVGNENEAPNNVTSLVATSGGSTSVILKWNTPSTNANSELASYELTFTPGGTAVTIPKGDNTYTVTGLTEGTTYVFTIKSKGTNNKLSNGTTVSWAPARRSSIIRLYGSSSSMGSGLDLDGNGGNPEVLRIAEGGRWDLCFDDKDPLNPGIGSPGQSGYVDNNFEFPNGQEAKKTYVSTFRWEGVTNLDQVFESEGLNAGTLEQLQLLNLSQPFAFVVKTEEGNYAKVHVLRNNGKFIQGSGSDEYIEVIVSYQSTANVPYALPQQPGQVQTPANNTMLKHATR